jgi:hypothetical protein
VEVVLVGFGESSYVRVNAVDGTLRDWLRSSRRLLAVRQVDRDTEPPSGAKYVAYFLTDRGEANTLWLSAEGIITIDFDVSVSPDRLLGQSLGPFILPPK